MIGMAGRLADVYEVRLQPGQLLFAPAGSVHAVRNTGAAINYGVSTNYVVSEHQQSSPGRIRPGLLPPSGSA